MGLFNSYMKEGPGIEKNAPKKHAFVVFFEILFRKFWKLINLNIIYFLFCIPIVTIGPATAAFTYVLRNFSREQHSFVWMDFLDAFKQNWKQSVVVEIVDAIMIFFGYLNFTFYNALIVTGKNIVLGYICLIAFIVILVLYTFMRYYIFMVLVTFKLKMKDVFKNAFILGVLGMPRNFLITVICGAILALLLTPAWLVILLLVPFFLLSLLGFITCFTAYPVLDKYLMQPSLKAQKGIDPFAEPKKDDEEEDDEEDDDEEEDEEDVLRIFNDSTATKNPELKEWNKRDN